MSSNYVRAISNEFVSNVNQSYLDFNVYLYVKLKTPLAAFLPKDNRRKRLRPKNMYQPSQLYTNQNPFFMIHRMGSGTMSEPWRVLILLPVNHVLPQPDYPLYL